MRVGDDLTTIFLLGRKTDFTFRRTNLLLSFLDKSVGLTDARYYRRWEDWDHPVLPSTLDLRKPKCYQFLVHGVPEHVPYYLIISDIFWTLVYEVGFCHESIEIVLWRYVLKSGSKQSRRLKSSLRTLDVLPYFHPVPTYHPYRHLV